MPLIQNGQNGRVSLEKLKRNLYKLSSLKTSNGHINVELEFHDFCAVYV